MKMSTKRKLPTKLGQPMVKPSAKPITKTLLNDATAVVSAGGQADTLPVDGKLEAIEISSDSESNSDEDISEIEDNADTLQKADVSMTEAQEEDDEDANAEPTFGDLVRNTLEPIDVSSAFPLAQGSAPNNLLAAPSSASLSTVLSQALKTNDNVLLESCLQTTDLATIRTTIQRLSSALASNLLSALATRLHRRPGRAGSLMIWIQWTLVAHGGYLATQKELVKQLAALSRVVEERARGLNGLLMLKGKLDMLEAQGAMRKSFMGRGRGRGDESEDDEDAVVYVEHDEEPETLANGAVAPRSAGLLQDQSDEDNDSSEDEDMPNTSAGLELNSEDDDESDDESQGLIDDEAEETGEDDSAEEEEVNFEDEDEVESGDESDDAAPGRGPPPTKLQKVGGLFSRNR